MLASNSTDKVRSKSFCAIYDVIPNPKQQTHTVRNPHTLNPKLHSLNPKPKSFSNIASTSGELPRASRERLMLAPSIIRIPDARLRVSIEFRVQDLGCQEVMQGLRGDCVETRNTTPRMENLMALMEHAMRTEFLQEV